MYCFKYLDKLTENDIFFQVKTVFFSLLISIIEQIIWSIIYIRSASNKCFNVQ